MPGAGIFVTSLNCLFFPFTSLELRESLYKFRHVLQEITVILNKNGFFYTLSIQGEKICLNLFQSR